MLAVIDHRLLLLDRGLVLRLQVNEEHVEGRVHLLGLLAGQLHHDRGVLAATHRQVDVVELLEDVPEPLAGGVKDILVAVLLFNSDMVSRRPPWRTD